MRKILQTLDYSSIFKAKGQEVEMLNGKESLWNLVHTFLKSPKNYFIISVYTSPYLYIVYCEFLEVVRIAPLIGPDSGLVRVTIYCTNYEHSLYIFEERWPMTETYSNVVRHIKLVTVWMNLKCSSLCLVRIVLNFIHLPAMIKTSRFILKILYPCIFPFRS